MNMISYETDVAAWTNQQGCIGAGLVASKRQAIKKPPLGLPKAVLFLGVGDALPFVQHILSNKSFL